MPDILPHLRRVAGAVFLLGVAFMPLAEHLDLGAPPRCPAGARLTRG
jgi:hypothetical protein